MTAAEPAEAPNRLWFGPDSWRVIGLILACKLAVLAVVYLGAYMLQPEAVYPHNYESAPGPSWQAFKSALYGWDAVHYVTLAEDGYEQGSFRNAFYPVLPYSIRALNLVTGDSIVSGLIVANLASGAGLYLLYVFVRRRYSAQTALTALALLLAFPTAFYLSIVYSEGPFLLLAAAFFLGLQSRNLPLVAVCAFLLPLTRPVGIFIAAPLAVWAMQEGWAKARETSPPDASFGKRLYDAIEAAPLQYLAAPALGLAALWAFMALAAGDTFAAYRAEQQFIGEYKVSEIIQPWHFFSDFFTTDLHLHGYLDSALDRLTFIAFLASLPLAWRRLDRPMFAFTLLLGIVPLFGSFLAYMRLVMSAFGLFVAYGQLGAGAKLRDRSGVAAPSEETGPRTVSIAPWVFAAVLPMALLQALFILLHTSNHWVA